MRSTFTSGPTTLMDPIKSIETPSALPLILTSVFDSLDVYSSLSPSIQLHGAAVVDSDSSHVSVSNDSDNRPAPHDCCLTYYSSLEQYITLELVAADADFSHAESQNESKLL